MAKTSHVGKSSRDQQLYAAALAHAAGDSTVQDDFLEPTPAESYVPEESDKRPAKQLSRRTYRRYKGLNGHLQNNMATYVVGILSGMLVVGTLIGFTVNGNVERMSSQVQSQKETLNRLEREISQVKNAYQSDMANLNSKLQDYAVRIQEQALRIQFLEKLIQKPSP